MLDPNSRNEEHDPRPKQGEPPHINNLDPYDFDLGRELRIAEISSSVFLLLDDPNLLAVHFRDIEENYSQLYECTDRDILCGGLTRCLQKTFEDLSLEPESIDRALRCFRKTSEIAALFFNHAPEGLSDAYKQMVVTSFEVASVLVDRVGANGDRLGDFDSGIRSLTKIFLFNGPSVPHQTFINFVGIPVSDFTTSILDEYVATNGPRNFPDDYHAHEISAITAVVYLATTASITNAREALFGMFVRLDYWIYWGRESTEADPQEPLVKRLTPEIEKLYLALIDGIRYTAELNLNHDEARQVRRYLWSLIDERSEEWVGFAPMLSTLLAIDPLETEQVKGQLLTMLIDPALDGKKHLLSPLLSFMKDGRDHLELVSSILRELGGDDAQRFYSLLSEECANWRRDGRASNPLRRGENAIEGISAKLEALVSRPAGSYFGEELDRGIY